MNKRILDFFEKVECFKRRFVNPETYICKIFQKRMGYPLNLDNPQTFNEKLQWLKLYDHNPLYTTLVDKFEVKKYVGEKIGKQYIIPTLGVWNSVDDIDFASLPNQFVLKCTHDSGGLVICKDKTSLNIAKAKKTLKKSLNRNFYYMGFEWPYKNVPPRIIAEKYMEDDKTKELRDYKFFCFDGEVKMFKVDLDRATCHRANYFDTNLRILDFGEVVCPPDFNRIISFPNNIMDMFKLAEELSSNIPFIRVDLYNTNDRIYFGELTFFPSSGFGLFTEDGWDMTIGNWINLPK